MKRKTAFNLKLAAGLYGGIALLCLLAVLIFHALFSPRFEDLERQAYTFKSYEAVDDKTSLGSHSGGYLKICVEERKDFLYMDLKDEPCLRSLRSGNAIVCYLADDTIAELRCGEAVLYSFEQFSKTARQTELILIGVALSGAIAALCAMGDKLRSLKKQKKESIL